MSSQLSSKPTPQQRSSGKKHIHKRLNKVDPEFFHNTLSRVAPTNVVQTKRSIDYPMDLSLNSSESVSPEMGVSTYSQNLHPEDVGVFPSLQDRFNLSRDEHSVNTPSQYWLPPNGPNITSQEQLQGDSNPLTNYWHQGENNWGQIDCLSQRHGYTAFNPSLGFNHNDTPNMCPSEVDYNVGLNSRTVLNPPYQDYYLESLEGVNNPQVFPDSNIIDSTSASYFYQQV